MIVAVATHGHYTNDLYVRVHEREWIHIEHVKLKYNSTIYMF